MSINSRARRTIAAAGGVALLASTASACFAEPSAMPTVRDFLIAWQVGNYKAAANLTTGADRKQVETALGQVRAQLDAASMKLELGVPVRSGDKNAKAILKNGDNAEARFSVKFDLGENGQPWTYPSLMKLKRIGGHWKVVWDASIIHPKLKNGQRLAVVSQVASRGQILNNGNQSLLAKVPAVVVGVVPGQLSDPKKTLDKMARATRASGTRLDVERLLGRVRSAPPERALPLLTLHATQHADLIARLRANVPELRFNATRLPIGATQAPEVVGTLGPATADRLALVGAPYQPGDTIGINGLQLSQQRRLAGTPTVRVVAQDPSGNPLEQLSSWPGADPQPIRTTIAARTQNRADQALKNLRAPASLVAVESSTGRILAVSNHNTDGRNAAFEAQYPPGMAFGAVSAEALIRSGMVDTDKVECPPSANVGGQTFTNPGPAPANKTLQWAFAYSCATTLANLSTKVNADALLRSASQFGIGKDLGLGVPAFTGSVPAPVNDGEKALTMVGQGKVRMSPLAMASMAVALDTGTWRPPYLLSDPRSPEVPQPQAMDSTVMEELRPLLQRSVANGTAKAAKVGSGGTVYGMAAQAESEGKTVSWFVGSQNGVAFAIAIEGRTNAAQVAAKFLSSGSLRPTNPVKTTPTR